MSGFPRSRLALSLAFAFAAAGCDETPYRQARMDGVSAAALPASPASQAPAHRALRVSVAAVESPRDTYGGYAKLFGHVARRLGTDVEYVQRRTYREVNDLLARGELDVAILCTGGYVELQRRVPGSVEILAVPLVDGQATYRSAIIVPANGPARTLADLAGARFAYTDELSLSGRGYVDWMLRAEGRDPASFFGSVIFTQSHDRSIAAVARGMVDGAAVHNRVLAHVIAHDPTIAARIRVIHESEKFGGMPVVASARLPPETRARLRTVLLELGTDPVAEPALRTLHVDGFVAPVPGMYQSAANVLPVR